MIKPPPQKVIAEFLCDQLLARTEWDAPHEFVSLVWDGSKLGYATMAMISTDVHPRDYPRHMARLGREAVLAWDPERPLIGFMLIVEAYEVVPPVEPTPEEAARLDRDRRERRFHERLDSVEIAMAMCAGLDGRLWSATKRRPNPDDIAMEFWADAQAFDPNGPIPGGAFFAGITAVAQAAAQLLSDAGAL